MMADKYKEQVRKLYETWAEYGEDGYTKDEVDALREMQEQLSEAVLAERDSLADIFGWDASGNSYSQSSSKGYSTTMSQETGEEISGRLTAMYESNVRLETKGTEMNANMLIISTAALNMAKELAAHSVCVTEMFPVDIGHWTGYAGGCTQDSGAPPAERPTNCRTDRQCSFRRRSHMGQGTVPNVRRSAADNRPIPPAYPRHDAPQRPGPARPEPPVSALRYAVRASSCRQNSERLRPSP